MAHNSSLVLGEFLYHLNVGRSEGDEIIIVDSGSSDHEATRALALQYDARLIACDQNIGYGAGSNLGCKSAANVWLALVNPDVTVRLSDLRVLASEAERNNVQCIGPQIIDAEGSSVHTARNSIVPPWRMVRHLVYNEANLTFSESISGSCMVMPADRFQEVKGFDNYFFMFCEEIDLHTRLRAAGGRIASTSAITVQTPGGGSSSTASRRWAVTERSVAHVRYTRKHFTLFEAAVDLLWRYFEIFRGGEFAPRTLSLRQLTSGVFRPRQRRN